MNDSLKFLDLCTSLTKYSFSPGLFDLGGITSSCCDSWVIAVFEKRWLVNVSTTGEEVIFKDKPTILGQKIT